MPDASRVPPGRSSSRERARRAARARRRSGWRARRRTAARRSAGCPRGRGPAEPPRCAARWRPSPRWRSGRCRRRTPTPPRACTAAIARIPEPQPTSSTRAPVDDAAVGQRLDRGQAQPGRRMEPGPERHPRVEREDDIVGPAPVAPPGRPDDQPPADAHDREVRLPGLGPVGLVDDPRAELADRPQPECLEVTERGRDLGHGAVGRGAVACRQVGPDGRRPGRVDPRAKALVDELERRLDRRPARSRPAEDLADGLDRLDVRLDRQLQPGAGAALARRRGVGRAHPSPSFSSSPPPPCPTELARLLGVRRRAARGPSSTAWSAPRRRPSRGDRRAGRTAAGAARPCRAA